MAETLDDGQFPFVFSFLLCLVWTFLLLNWSSDVLTLSKVGVGLFLPTCEHKSASLFDLILLCCPLLYLIQQSYSPGEQLQLVLRKNMAGEADL